MCDSIKGYSCFPFRSNFSVNRFPCTHDLSRKFSIRACA